MDDSAKRNEDGEGEKAAEHGEKPGDFLWYTKCQTLVTRRRCSMLSPNYCLPWYTKTISFRIAAFFRAP